VHFNNGFADERCTKERTERNKEMAACDSGEIKQRVGNLRHTKQLAQLLNNRASDSCLMLDCVRIINCRIIIIIIIIITVTE